MLESRSRVLIGFAILLLSSCNGSHELPQSDPAARVTPATETAPQAPDLSSDSSMIFQEISDRWFTTANGGPDQRPQYRNGEETNHCSILESLGGGVGLADFDRDGWVDAVFPGGGEITSEQIIRGRSMQHWRGQPDSHSLHVSISSNIPAPRAYSHGVAVGDYDEDGFHDLLITGYQGIQLLRNLGDGTWSDETVSTHFDSDTTWCSSAAWGDINGDGWLDLYVAHYVDWSFQNHPECLNPKLERDICPPRQFHGLADWLWLNQGDGTFENGSKKLGLRSDGKGLGALIADLDVDGDLDIYVTNDTTPNFLYRNEGGGQFVESGMMSGTGLSDVGTPDGSMGVSLGDFDNDGLPDLWVANYEREVFALYRNQGQCLFQHISQSAGIAALGGAFVGFGTAFGDWDLDGDEDLVVSNGHVQHLPTNSPVLQLPLLLANQGGRRFVNVGGSAGDYFRKPHLGRGLATADLDHDGDNDLVFTPTNEPAAVLENRSGHTSRWLQLTLSASRTSRDAIGAQVTINTSQGPRARQVTSGGSYLSHSERVLSWGFPEGCQIQQVTITWPSGLEQKCEVPTENARYLIREGLAPVVMFPSK